MDTFGAYLSAFIMLFVVANPLGCVPIFAGLTSGMSAKLKSKIAVKAPFIAFCLLVFFALVGEPFLAAVGISLPAFKIAGGFMLFIIAVHMLFTNKLGVQPGKKASDNISVFPLAIPLLAGPGSITAVILQVGENPTLGRLLSVISMAAGVFALCAVLFLTAGRLSKYLNENVNNIITKLFGLTLGALSVQFVIDGVISVVQAFSK